MPYIKIDRERCKGCMLCLNVCPKKQLISDKALNQKGVYPAVFLNEDCSGCALCAVVCPDMAIEVYK